MKPSPVGKRSAKIFSNRSTGRVLVAARRSFNSLATKALCLSKKSSALRRPVVKTFWFPDIEYQLQYRTNVDSELYEKIAPILKIETYVTSNRGGLARKMKKSSSSLIYATL